MTLSKETVRALRTKQATSILPGEPVGDGVPSAPPKSERTKRESLEGETAILIIWNNPVTTDPERYLTTLVTVDPQGLGRVWVLKRDRVLAARSGDNAQPMKMAKDESYSIFKSVLHVGTFGSGGSFAGAYQPLIEWLKSEFKQTQELGMLTGELVGYPGVVSDPEGSVSVPDPIAVIKFGRRRREPWKDMAQEPVSYVKPMKELEPVEGAVAK